MEKEFIDDAMERAAPFVKLAILPELVGKWFTRKNTRNILLSSVMFHIS